MPKHASNVDCGHSRVSLSQSDRMEVFRIATRSFTHRFKEQIASGMTDHELKTALSVSLGSFGGSGGPNRLSVIYQGSGLKIWGRWHVVNHVIEPPLFAGQQTIDMARELYGIADPDDNQFSLF